MKTCFKCKRTLPEDCFYKHPRMEDGRLNKCKDCTKLDTRQNRMERLEYYRQYDATRPNKIERIRECNRRRKEDPEKEHKQHARITALNALRDGRLKKQPCFFCGSSEQVEMHHPDYSQPLKVYWLCQICHKRFHVIAGK